MPSEFDVIPFEDAALWGGDEFLIDLDVVDDCIVGVIPIERVTRRDPFKASPWFDGQSVTVADVQAAVAEGRLEATAYPGFQWSRESEWNDRRHAERIAYLVANKAHDPISIEFVNPEGKMEVNDGWHRLAAALLRGEKEISVAVGGYFRHSVARLGAICRAYQRIGEPEVAFSRLETAPAPI